MERNEVSRTTAHTFPTRSYFDRTAFDAGLQSLSNHVRHSTILSSFRPIEMVASGGFVSVSYFGIRPSTQDLDYFLNEMSFGEYYQVVRFELQQQIAQVGATLHYDRKWCNDEVSLFLTLLENPAELFNRSKAQNIRLYEDENLIVYAVLWEWVLARKLKRLQMEGQTPRVEDWNDCITIAWQLCMQNNGPVDRAVLKQFDHPVKEPPVFEETLAKLRDAVKARFGVDPFS
ncbi:hypothetical protein K431DRAFT_315143 [Polychaeton citri CBS 116435]|uniref:Uncharacterized protein n=1 Tax=Polychaeton citri CBS 116435 TaxID=1314669 RepID=A0A9P4Q058_9PEZI|nr:hypothetical protein K431DRAFT_315143 [Polychaeton citri CBS 116435]